MSLISFSDNFAQICLCQNYQSSDSISANLKSTIQTKQHAMKKPHSYSNRNKIYKGLFFVVEGFWAENVQFLLIQ